MISLALLQHIWKILLFTVPPETSAGGLGSSLLCCADCKPIKFVFVAAKKEYLGYIIGKGVIQPQVSKIQAIESCPWPQIKKQLRSFLGMAGFYHCVIVHFPAREA